jgi:hypothetical protein
MSELAKQLFDGLRAAAEGVAVVAQDGLGQMAAEGKRLGIHGSMEFASGVLAGQSFVQYGPGQSTPTPTPERMQQTDHGMER